jgi:lipopolysaccharide transport protein LptA
MTQLKFARTIRLVFVAVLVVVVAVILWYFLSHRRPRTFVPQKEEVIPAEKVERQDRVEHLDFKGDRVIQAKAERHYAGEDGRYILEGNVEIRELGKKEGEEVVLSGDKVSYDEDWKEAYLEGHARLQYRGLNIESVAFVYRDEDEILATDQPVAFSSSKISGKAGSMVYSFRKESLRFEHNVELRLVEATESEVPFMTYGDIVTFQRRRRHGTVEGNASFSFGKSRGRADILVFDLTADEQYARRFSLKGNAEATFVDENEGAVSPVPLAAERRERHISADEIDLRVFKDMHMIHRVEAWNRCQLRFSTSGREDAGIRSGRMRMFFERTGSLREFLAWNDARLEQRGSDPEKERLISGQEIWMGRRGAPWRIKAREGGEVRVISLASEIAARSLTVYPGREIMKAAGDVKIILQSRPENEAVGFFSSGQPVFGAAQEMRYEEKTDRLELRENVRMWQGQEIIFADRLAAWRKTGEVTGEGHVRAFLRHLQQSEGAEEEKIEVGGEKMRFMPRQNLLVFEQACWLKSSRLEMNSRQIKVLFGEKSAGIRQIEAQGDVTIAEELREGSGENALYLLEEETMILTGNPKVTDKEKGAVEGEKLTFRLGEGRIQVENKDRERSTTVIKS